MNNDRGFQPIKRPARDEDSLLEELAAKKGVARLQNPNEQPPPALPQAPDISQQRGGGQGRGDIEPAPDAPTPRTRMKAMNLELPDYVMQQLKERAIREDCSVRHIIMKGLAGEGIAIRAHDMITDGRRNRGKGSL